MEDIEAMGVLTYDLHFEFLELRAFNHDVLRQIQSYTISMTNFLHLNCGGAYGITFAGAGIWGALKILLDMWKRAPISFQVAVVGATCFALLHEGSRNKIGASVEMASRLAQPLISGLVTYVDMMESEHRRAENLKREVLAGRIPGTF
jgi:hypothetical protein